MKTCSKCKMVKQDEEFHTRPNGKRYSNCKECQRAYVRDHYARNKEYYIKKARVATNKRKSAAGEFIDAYLAEHPCVDCGFSDSRALQFDHVRGEKKFNISEGRRGDKWRTIDDLVDEIKKCDVRCANCHQIVTRERAAVSRQK